jgi:hypothetical protein
VQEGHPTRPGIAVGDFVPRDWREQARKIRKQYNPKAESEPLFSIPKITNEGADTEKTSNNERSEPKEEIISNVHLDGNSHLNAKTVNSNEHLNKRTAQDEYPSKTTRQPNKMPQKSNHRIQRKKVYVNTKNEKQDSFF